MNEGINQNHEGWDEYLIDCWITVTQEELEVAVENWLIQNDGILLGCTAESYLDDKEWNAILDAAKELLVTREGRRVKLIRIICEVTRRIEPKLERLMSRMPQHDPIALEVSVARRAVYHCLGAYERDHHLEAADGTEGLPIYEEYSDDRIVRFWRDEASSSC